MLALAAAVSGAASVTAFADTNYGLEEVVVTAQKRAESLQDIPLAVTAFSGDQIREDGIASMEDIGSRTPGMVFAAFSAGQPEIAIRGIGTKEDGAAASDSTVVSIDDVYIAARTAQVFDIFDLERVEVLRGPQGTLYGKNSIGGSINFVTSKPTEETKARVRATAGNYGRRDLGGMLSGGLTDNLFGKIAFSSRDYDGHVRHVPSGDHWHDEDTFAWRSQLRWLASDNLELIFTADGADDDNGSTNREPVGSGPGAPASSDSQANTYNNPVAVNQAMGERFGVDASDPHNSFSDDEGFTKRDVEGYSLKVNWDLEQFTFTSITAYRESEFDWLEDSEGLPAADKCTPCETDPLIPLPGPEVGFRRDASDAVIEDTEQLTQEFRLTSSGESSVDWVVGLFYSQEEINRAETFHFGNSSVGTPNYLGNVAVAPTNISIQSSESESWAVYGQAGFDLTETLALTAGLRYSTEEKEVSNAGEAFLDVFGSADATIAALGIPSIDILNTTSIAVTVAQYDAIEAENDWSNVSGRLALDWTPSEDILVYGSISTGFKSGGFTGSSSNPNRAARSFDPEEAINYELGIKSQWFDNRLQLNVAAFYTDYEDLQVTRFYLPHGSTAAFGEFITENAAEATIQGMEVEFLAMPTANLEIGGSFAYLNAEYDDFQPDTPNACAEDLINGCIPDYSGNKLRQAPRKTASLFGKYNWQLDNDWGDVSAKVNYRFQGHSFYDPDNNDLTSIPQYRLWDARLAWTSSEGNWEVAAWVKNLTDEEYRTHIYSQRGSSIAFATFGAPKTSGLTVTYNY